MCFIINELMLILLVKAHLKKQRKLFIVFCIFSTCLFDKNILYMSLYAI